MILDELEEWYWAIWMMMVIHLLIIAIPVCMTIYHNKRVIKDNGILSEVLYCPVVRLATGNNEIFYSYKGRDYLYAFQSEIEAIVFAANQKGEGKADMVVEERKKVNLEGSYIYFKPVQRAFILVRR